MDGASKEVAASLLRFPQAMTGGFDKNRYPFAALRAKMLFLPWIPEASFRLAGSFYLDILQCRMKIYGVEMQLKTKQQRRSDNVQSTLECRLDRRRWRRLYC